MKLTAEIAIDLDDKRRVWIAANAEGVNPDEHDVAAIQEALQSQVTAQGLDAYNMVKPTVTMTAADVVAAAKAADTGGPAPSERRPRPGDPPTMRAFGEDDDEEDAN